jgi:hypothetical protein
MPALPKQRVFARAADATIYDQMVTAAVTVEGVFTLGVPDDLIDIAETLKHSAEWIKEHIEIDHCRGSRLHVKTLAIGINFLRACAEEFLKVDITTDRLIVYSLKLFAECWLDKNGKIQPNGEDDDGSGGWWKPKHEKFTLSLHATCPQYALGVGAQVWDRTTYHRSTGKTFTWERAEGEDGDPIDQLHRFVRLHLHPEESEFHVETMPYTPEAAMFFVNILLGLCSIIKNVDDFFADPKRLEAAIGGRLALTLGGT